MTAYFKKIYIKSLALSRFCVAGTELMAKAQVMSKYPAYEKIAIGDSITDLNMALRASIVFARDRLAEYLDEQHKTYIPWNNFLDVRDYLAQLWNNA